MRFEAGKFFKSSTAAVLMLFGWAVQSQAETVLFEDNFDSGSMSPQWVSKAPTQWVQNGWLYTKNIDNDLNGSSMTVVHDSDFSWTDYKVSATAQFNQHVYTESILLFRVNNFYRDSQGIKGSSYMLHFIDSPEWQHGYILLDKIDEYAGKYSQLFTGEWNNSGSPTNIVVLLTGNRIILSVDGQDVFDITDHEPLLFGGIGVHTKGDTEAHFDNFKVTKADEKRINPDNGHSYQRFDTPLSWNAAKTACEGLGAHLATSTSQAENDWILSNLGAGASDVWLGGTDQAQEGVWQWITEESWNYTNWHPSEPNGGEGENYLQIRMYSSGGSLGFWNDLPNEAGVPSYICEWEDNDSDNDGINDTADNCPSVANPDQLNNDGDAQGDVCDTDDDNDAVLDSSDNCPLAVNADQTNNDGDSIGDVCDDDDDNDTVLDAADNCKFTANADQSDIDGDGQGDACDGDQDGDGVANAADNCPAAANADQADNDGDAQGDACDADDDNDTVLDAADNCPADANADQKDLDGDNIGDVCDLDMDGDGRENAQDNCPANANADQEDTDFDGAGDACDEDDDNDGVLDAADNCSLMHNPGQENADGDAQGDVCDGDLDGDGIANNTDNCPNAANASQNDYDSDGKGDACDDDVDGDGVANSGDVCGFTELDAVVKPAEGCSIAQLCPCEGPRGTTGAWKNHGGYVSCTAKSAESFVGLNLITEAEKDAAVSAAAESDCGAKK